MSARCIILITTALSVAAVAHGSTYRPEVKTALDTLGLREQVVVVRADTFDGDTEPLFLAFGPYTEPTFFRAGEEQCMDKMVNTVPCSDDSGDPAEAQAIQWVDNAADDVALASHLPDWAGTPLPTQMIGDTIYVVVPAPKPLPHIEAPLPAVSLPGAGWIAGGALAVAGVAVAVKRRRT